MRRYESISHSFWKFPKSLVCYQFRWLWQKKERENRQTSQTDCPPLIGANIRRQTSRHRHRCIDRPSTWYRLAIFRTQHTVHERHRMSQYMPLSMTHLLFFFLLMLSALPRVIAPQIAVRLFVARNSISTHSTSTWILQFYNFTTAPWNRRSTHSTCTEIITNIPMSMRFISCSCVAAPCSARKFQSLAYI